MTRPLALRYTLAFVALFLSAHVVPAPGWPGGLMVIPAVLMLVLTAFATARGMGLGWIWLGYLLGFVGMFHWMPRMISVMGGLPTSVGWVGLVVFAAYEAAGPTLALGLFRALKARRGLLVATLATAGFILFWEGLAFHIYPINWAYSLGAVPVLARATAFTGSWGAAVLMWVAALWTGARLAEGDRSWRSWGPLAALPALLGLLGLGWHLLPRESLRTLDVVVVQPNLPPGRVLQDMEALGWTLTDEALRQAALPRADAPTLVVWAESAILGWDHRGPAPALGEAARSRGVTWLFGTEGGHMNLVRGETAGRPPLVLGKVHPMPFGERMPGPEPLRQWLDRQAGRRSQVPGNLSSQSSLDVPGPGAPIRVHPIICSEGLMPGRVLEGLAVAGGDLLTNHTNDGWFETSLATDQHAAQIRLRATEAGLPLIRATLTGKSGLFREDGTWELWGEPMTQATRTFRLSWQPVRTPWKQTPYRYALLGAFLAALAWALTRRPTPA